MGITARVETITIREGVMAEAYVVEHLNHLGIVAEVCREIGVAEWLDQQDPTRQQHVSVGTATVAMVLNGLGFSNRQLYLVPQFFADKPIEHLLGPGIHADDLNDDCLGRTLDWLYAHDVTALFAGLALRARRAFGISLHRLHADTTSFSVEGAYDREDEETVIHVTYGYSRDRRADLKQWMLALITSGEGIPQFLQPLDGNASDKVALLHVIECFHAQVHQSDEEAGVYVADSGVYSEANITRLNQAGVSWISRVPETSLLAQADVSQQPEHWQSMRSGTVSWWTEIHDLPQGRERWLIVRTTEGEERTLATMQRQAVREQTAWEKRWHRLSQQVFACETDAQAAMRHLVDQHPAWLVPYVQVQTITKHAQRGRPAKETSPQTVGWHIQARVVVDPTALKQEALRRAAFIIGTSLLDAQQWSDEAIITLYREQAVVERGFAFLKDPLFLASSVFVKKPQRIMALAFVMVLCLLVYKLAEVRVRQQLAATRQTMPDQLRRPTARPTMRWLFQCFEGVDLHHTLLPSGIVVTDILRLTDLHRLVLHLLGPTYEQCYFARGHSGEDREGTHANEQAG
jgi:transposase